MVENMQVRLCAGIIEMYIWIYLKSKKKMIIYTVKYQFKMCSRWKDKAKQEDRRKHWLIVTISIHQFVRH